MHEAGISARRKRRRVITTRRDASHPVAPNVLPREFTATEPNTKWATDITYIPTMQGWLYLAVILDLYSRAVVGWSMSSCCDEELVENALKMAVLPAFQEIGGSPPLVFDKLAFGRLSKQSRPKAFLGLAGEAK